MSDEAFAEEELSDQERLPALDDDEDMLAAGVTPGRRLWDKRVLFPAGVKRWDNTANCQAALAYECPCGQRCLSKVGDVLRLYEHRRSLRANCRDVNTGQLRDKLRQKLEEHYDAEKGKFSQSFVVAGVGEICERAYAVAAGVSETTFVRARSDVTLKRPTHHGRVRERVKRVSCARAHLDSWVRAQRNSMEGDKTSGLKWYTEKVTERQLWMRYLKCCDKAQVCAAANL